MNTQYWTGNNFECFDFKTRMLDYTNQVDENTILSSFDISAADSGTIHRVMGIILENGLKNARKFVNLYDLGIALTLFGELSFNSGSWLEAIQLYKLALAIHRKTRNRRYESNALFNLGKSYTRLGKVRKAIEFYIQLLVTHRKTLNKAYGDFDLDELMEYYLCGGGGEEYWMISDEIRARGYEGVILGIMGNAYADIGKTRKAIKLYKQSLSIHRVIGLNNYSGITNGNLGICYYQIGEREMGIAFMEQALVNFKDIKSRNAALARSYLQVWEVRGREAVNP